MRLYGEIMKVGDQPNSYVRKTERSKVIRRNRWHIVPAPYRHNLYSENHDTPVLVDQGTADHHTAKGGVVDSAEKDVSNR